MQKRINTLNFLKLGTEEKLNWIKLSLLIVLVTVFSSELSFCAVIVIQTGVASPQSEAEEKNIEKLRERAIRNAMDLAVMQVSGALISGERGETLRSREEVAISDNDVRQQTKQQSHFHGSVVSRTIGHVRLIDIVKEWREGGQYYVKAKIEVGDSEESIKKMNAGFYWERVGMPRIVILFSERTNGQDTTETEAYTLRYLRDNLVQNGIVTATDKVRDAHYHIKVTQTYQTMQLSEFGTYTTHCKLLYEITDNESRQTVAEYRASHGPNPGFSEEQAQESCIKAIAPQVSENLIREIAAIFSDRWNQGTKFQVLIHGLPGEFVTQAGDTLENLFQVTNSSNTSYRNNALQINLVYKGTASSLADAIIAVFDEFDRGVVIESLQGNQVEFRWTQK